MPFFLKKRTNKTKVTVKRKKKGQKDEQPVKKALISKSDVDVPSDDEEEEDEDQVIPNGEAHDEDEVAETAEERKLRLAKKYLEEIEREEKERLEEQDIDKSITDSRRKDDESKQRIKLIADKILPITSQEKFRFLRNGGHKLSVTCVCLTTDCKFLFSGGKEGNLIKWCFPTGKQLHFIKSEKKSDDDEARVGHCRALTSIAVSSDGKFLASSDGCKDVRIWDPETMALIHRFTGHRGPVTGVVFRKSSHTLYSCSEDRSVKVWDVDEMTYVEDLFGHQEPITSIDSLVRERAITAGGRDSTIRLWKIPEESQLVFQGSGQSIDCVRFLEEQHFVSGGEDGSISLWGLLKKKAVAIVKQAHGVDQSSRQPNWITSIATLVNSNLCASGSCDGFVRLWKTDKECKRLEPLFAIPVTGFVNALQFSSTGDSLVIGVGQEHRLGRWWRIKEARNQIIVVPLQLKE